MRVPAVERGDGLLVSYFVVAALLATPRPSRSWPREQIEGGRLLQRFFDHIMAATAHVAAASSNLASGADGRTIGASVFLTSSETPVGVWRHWHVDGTGRPDETALAHSSLYGDPRVIAEVLAWIRRRTDADLG